MGHTSKEIGTKEKGLTRSLHLLTYKAVAYVLQYNSD